MSDQAALDKAMAPWWRKHEELMRALTDADDALRAHAVVAVKVAQLGVTEKAAKRISDQHAALKTAVDKADRAVKAHQATHAKARSAALKRIRDQE